MPRKFPPARACIFDVDGTLINSEDIYTTIYNNILHEYGRPSYPWTIKALQQSRGVPGTQLLLNFAQIPLSMPEWKDKQQAYTNLFTSSELLPGVSELLQKVSSTDLKLAIASSAGSHLFFLKTSHLPIIESTFPQQSVRIFGNDPEMAECEKKPAPDAFLLALKRLNEQCHVDNEAELKPEECLVFEDSIAGVEAGREAGMRTVWIPHPGLANVCRGREMDVLMGRLPWGELSELRPIGSDETIRRKLMEGKCVVSEDGRAEMRKSLEKFPIEDY